MSWLYKDPVVIMKEIMHWLFKNPINSGLAQIDHPQSNSKNSLNAKKIKLLQMNFVPKKQLIKFSCTYQRLSFCKIQNWFRVDSELWGCAPFLGPKQPICLEPNFFGINHSYYFHLPMALFIVQNFKKILQWI